MGIRHGTWALVKLLSQDLPAKGGTGELERATTKYEAEN